MHDYEAEVVNRSAQLRTESRDAVATIEASIERMEVARAAIEEHQQELAVSRAELEEREAALNAAQAERREELNKLKGKEDSLVEALSTPAPTTDPATGETVAPAPTETVAPPERLHGDDQLRRNGDGARRRPAGGQGRDRRRQPDHEHARTSTAAVTARSTRPVATTAPGRSATRFMAAGCCPRRWIRPAS